MWEIGKREREMGEGEGFVILPFGFIMAVGGSAEVDCVAADDDQVGDEGFQRAWDHQSSGGRHCGELWGFAGLLVIEVKTKRC